MKKVSSIWVILDSHDNYCAFGSKVAWISSGAAKNAFSCHTQDYSNGYGTPIKLKGVQNINLLKLKYKEIYATTIRK